MECSVQYEGLKNRLFRWCDGLTIILSVAITFILIGIVIAWTFQTPGIAYLNLDRTYRVQEGQTFSVEAPLAINSMSGSVYQIKVIDQFGDLAYSVENLESDDFMTSIIIPSLSKGVYSISGTLSYKMNPIKTARVVVNFGNVAIGSTDFQKRKHR